MDDRASVQFFGRDQRKSIPKIKSHLMTKNAQCAGARTVILAHALAAHSTHQIQILPHALYPSINA